MSLLESMTLEDAAGDEVALLQAGYRHVQAVDGLQGLQARVVVRPRPSQHGSVSLSRFRDSRTITVNGMFLGESADRAWDEYHAVSTALAGAVDTDRLLRYRMGGLDLQMLVRCEAVQAPVEYGKPNIVATQYVLRANDPRAYSQSYAQASASASSSSGGGLIAPLIAPLIGSQPVGSTVSVTNNGTVGSPGIITLGGYLVDPRVSLGDKQIVFDGVLLAGEEIVIDLGTRDVYLNGSPGVHLLDFALTEWFEIPPGTSVIGLLQADSDVSASITVAYNDAYQ